MRLFEPGPVDEHVTRTDEYANLSADARRTRRRQTDIAKGIHPVTRVALLDPDWGNTCGNCDHFRRGERYHKCALTPGGPTGGAATDMRVNWPACIHYQES